MQRASTRRCSRRQAKPQRPSGTQGQGQARDHQARDHCDHEAEMPRPNDETRDAVSIDTYVQFLLLGIGAGAIYAAIALGLLLTYRSSGVINFAHAAAAMYAAYVFVGLRVDGDLLLPLPGAAGRIHLHTLPTAAAATVAVVAPALLELAIYFLVFRPLRDAPALSGLVASVGVMVALQAIVTLQYGADAVSVPRILPATPIHLGSVVLPSDRLWLAAIVIAATAGLSSLYRFTRFGL